MGDIEMMEQLMSGSGVPVCGFGVDEDGSGKAGMCGTAELSALQPMNNYNSSSEHSCKSVCERKGSGSPLRKFSEFLSGKCTGPLIGSDLTLGTGGGCLGSDDSAGVCVGVADGGQIGGYIDGQLPGSRSCDKRGSLALANLFPVLSFGADVASFEAASILAASVSVF